MDKRIKNFLKDEHLLCLSVCDENGVYPSSCYYVFCEENLSLCFKSDKDSKHIQLAKQNPKISANIHKDSKILGLLKGVQIKATFRNATQCEEALYYKRFPFARLGNGEVFALVIDFAKYTDNKLLLKEKLTYIKE